MTEPDLLSNSLRIEGKKVVLHCSDSLYGCFQVINRWHMKRYKPVLQGQDNSMVYCGYHFVIGNGFLFNETAGLDALDGVIEVGRSLEFPGECAGMDKSRAEEFIQICLIGTSGNFTAKQLTSVNILLRELKPAFVLQHSDFKYKRKAFCAGFSSSMMDVFNNTVGARLKFNELY